VGKELIINVGKGECRIALLNEGRLSEYHVENLDTNFAVGDIYLGKVTRLIPGLNACFVDIGHNKNAFLHYLDLGIHYNDFKNLISVCSGPDGPKVKKIDFNKLNRKQEIDKGSSIDSVLAKDDLVLAQIVKEPISSKGPRLSTEISIAGRYVILMPFGDTISVSKKIVNNSERNRLQRLISFIRPNNFGVIARTVAKGKKVEELDKDLKGLLEKWMVGVAKLGTASTGDRIIGEMNRASALLRDILNESFDSIVIDNQNFYEELRDYIKVIEPSKEKIVKNYHSKAKIFEHFGIEKQIKSLFGKVVNIDSGGYLVIEHTEAMHVIDVNSGSKKVSGENQEVNAFNLNMSAAKEIARQIMLRDMGGIIAIDFVDMKDRENKIKVYQAVKEEMKRDRSKVTVLPLSKLCLMQITRQRVRPAIKIATEESCPSCKGTGKMDASILVADKIEKDLHYLLDEKSFKKLTIFLHPYIYAYFINGLISKRIKWLFKYKKWINLEVDSSLGIVDYLFMDEGGNEINIE
jgi:ribonuclease G